MRVSVVIPLHNEEENLKRIIPMLPRALGRHLLRFDQLKGSRNAIQGLRGQK
jgi:hypothetical protein